MLLKRCNDCGLEKPLSEFGLHKGSPRHHCKPCKNAESREWYKNNKEKKAEFSKAYRRTKKDQDLKKAYGIGVEQYDKYLDYQKYRCALCSKHADDHSRALAVDHCHTTGIIRGLLCDPCNRAIGFLKDDPDLLRKAADYVESGGILSD